MNKPDKDPSTPSFDSSQLFSTSIQELSYEHREAMAQTFIERFSFKPIDEDLLQQAGIRPDNIDSKRVSQARRKLTDPSKWELGFRLNYCQFLIESTSGQQIPLYDKMIDVVVVAKEDVQKIEANSDDISSYIPIDRKTWIQTGATEFRVVRSPFLVYAGKDKIMQMNEDTRIEFMDAARELNRFLSEESKEEYTITPAPNLYGVLYFSTL